MGRRRGSKSYSEKELLEFINSFIESEGRVPERRDFENNDKYPSWRQYVTKWGSWGQALISLGFRDFKKEKKQLKEYKCKISYYFRCTPY